MPVAVSPRRNHWGAHSDLLRSRGSQHSSRGLQGQNIAPQRCAQERAKAMSEVDVTLTLHELTWPDRYSMLRATYVCARIASGHSYRSQVARPWASWTPSDACCLPFSSLARLRSWSTWVDTNAVCIVMRCQLCWRQLYFLSR